jgi:arabinogalactan endo-1,4-beta-galactosidase
VTRQAVKAQQEGYQKAETAYTKTIEAADKAFAAAQAKAAQSGDQSILATAQAVKDRDYAQAVIDREKAKGRVAAEYDAAVKSIGGTPGAQAGGNLPPGWQ